MSFLETPRFPISISYGSLGGPGYSTDVAELGSGHEQRNRNWEYPRHDYDASYGIRRLNDMEDVIGFFHVMVGRVHGFRYKDWLDYKSCGVLDAVLSIDMEIGTGDGSETEFQLVKIYTKGALSQTRQIRKPVADSTVIAIKTISDLRWSVDTTTGLVTFSPDLNYTITNAVSSGANTIFTVAAIALASGDSVWLDGFTGDWAGLNDDRYVITAQSGTTFTIAFDSSGYAAYSANGGETHTIPQTAEAVTAGYEFDVPCRFDADKLSVNLSFYKAGSARVPIIEIK